MKNWDQIVNKSKRYVVKIKTPSGSGTGFLCHYNDTKTWCGIATAAHVVDDADEWLQPIKIIYDGSEVLLKDADRVVFLNRKTDSAMIVVEKSKLEENTKLPDELIRLRPLKQELTIGSEVGWLGFPFGEDTLCFFSGCISARNDDEKAYLIDGVSISGVSGGPVLYSSETEGIEIIGVVAAYRANRTSGVTLPGLSIAQDVSHFHSVIKTIRTLDEAKKQKETLKEKQEQEQKSIDNFPPPSKTPSTP